MTLITPLNHRTYSMAEANVRFPPRHTICDPVAKQSLFKQLFYVIRCYRRGRLAAAAERLARAPALDKELLVAKYFLHLRDGSDELLDPEGCDYPTLEAMRRAVLVSARDLIADDVRNGRIDLRFRIDAHDEAGAFVYSLPFKHALSIISEDEATANSLAV